MKTIKRILCITMALLLGLGLFAPAAAATAQTPEGPRPWHIQPLLIRVPQDIYGMIAFGSRRVAILIYHDGYLVYENYRRNFCGNTPLPAFSVTKSMLATIIGAAIYQGYVECITQLVYPFFPEVVLDEQDNKRNMTIEHLMLMTSGLPSNNLGLLLECDDMGLAAFSLPQSREPGENYSYCNTSGPQVLVSIVERATGQGFFEFAQAHVFEPLGMTSISWDTTRCGRPLGAWGLRISALDMLRWGQLKLYDGVWDNTRILPEGWTELVRPDNVINPMSIGHLWWGSFINPIRGTAFAARGLHGQFLTIYPSDNTIVVRTGTGPVSRL